MARYKIHISLQDHEGAKTDRTYTCTRETIFEAPEGEFKDLKRGQYSRLDSATESTESEGDESSSDTDTDE